MNLIGEQIAITKFTYIILSLNVSQEKAIQIVIELLFLSFYLELIERKMLLLGLYGNVITVGTVLFPFSN